jgi:hypothetical protein
MNRRDVTCILLGTTLLNFTCLLTRGIPSALKLIISHKTRKTCDQDPDQ